MRRWNTSQWMALGYVAALLLVLLAGVLASLDADGGVLRMAGALRIAAAGCLLAYVLAVHRILSSEPVSGFLLVGVAFAALVLRRGVAQLEDGGDPGTSFLGSRLGDVAVGALLVASAALPLRRNAAAPRNAWGATAILAAVAAAAVVLAVWVPAAVVLGQLATSLWLFSSSLFAWQAARAGVRLGGPRSGWITAR
ncbi:MAG TPA: hypothetical protein VFH47_09045 [Candidatus Thermoplasmatota archaeon]|nr:hypothetical protein [Candidatus Thermoplasmatota archaeon]